ncbi:hypothetical protein IP86_05985 [Rhodopseudomonas sp. AAP120]|nr:hypothetical protein IP86_05985 [Rhodopseudomonas sp. AAP120]
MVSSTLRPDGVVTMLAGSDMAGVLGKMATATDTAATTARASGAPAGKAKRIGLSFGKIDVVAGEARL